MTPEQEIAQLKSQLRSLESKLDMFMHADRFYFTRPFSFGDGITMNLGKNKGTKIGTTTTEKLAFFGSTPVVQFATSFNSTIDTTYGSEEANTLEGIRDALISYGLIHS